METWRNPADFRPVVISNPNSTRAERTQQDVVDVLSDSYWGEPEQLQTEFPCANENAEVIAKHVREGDVLLACGGDGLAHSVANALRLRPELQDKAWMMPLPVGNACDISMSVYGEDILRKGKLTAVMRQGEDRNLDVIGVGVNEQERWAVGYVSVGLTARLAELYANHEYRQRRPASGLRADIHDLWSTGQMLRYSRPFKYEDGDLKDMTGIREAHEILCANMPRLAKFGKVAVSAYQGSVIKEVSAGRYARGVAAAIGQLVSPAGLKGETLEERQLTICQTDTAVPYQLDGEVGYLQYGDSVRLTKTTAALPIVGPVQ